MSLLLKANGLILGVCFSVMPVLAQDGRTATRKDEIVAGGPKDFMEETGDMALL